MDAIVNKLKKSLNYDFLSNKIKNHRFFVTGATGLIGSNIIDFLLDCGGIVIGLARNREKAKEYKFYDRVEWIWQGMEEQLSYDEDIDYIIHTASPTDSKYFITNPVETINSTIKGLNNVLEFAKNKNIKKLIYTSSMEVYGLCLEDKFLKENEYYSIDCTNIRNSYAEGKKILECLCMSYCLEYNVPISIVRLCQTFGPGVSKNDNRVFAQFAKCVTNNENIILSTKGETKRLYCSLTDCVNGILIALFNGENGQVYNIASDDTYYSIYEMAKKFTKGTDLSVEIKEQKDNKYLPTIKFGLDTSKIKKIGFISVDNLDSIISEFLSYWHN